MALVPSLANSVLRESMRVDWPAVTTAGPKCLRLTAPLAWSQPRLSLGRLFCDHRQGKINPVEFAAGFLYTVQPTVSIPAS
jgi:hypothetical protein